MTSLTRISGSCECPPLFEDEQALVARPSVLQSVRLLAGRLALRYLHPPSPAFLQAADQGLPLRHLDELAPPAVAFLFDNLAAEAAQRLELQATERKPRQFLL